MPIYEYYCPDNHRIYQFYAKTLAQGRTVPKCPDNPGFRMERVVSTFSLGKGKGEGPKGEPERRGGDGGKTGETGDARDAAPWGDASSEASAKEEAALSAMEREFSGVDENDPRAMGRMMRRMSELTGERIDGDMEEVVRKLEEGADPESLDEQFGGDEGSGDESPLGGGPDAPPPPDPREPRARLRGRSRPPSRDPKLYDY
jgi:hypothetical protein